MGIKTIVTTTINEPTEAILKYIALDWNLIVVGDKKTPEKPYRRLEKKYPSQVVYLSPDDQEKKYQRLSDLIGWNCIQRRSIGFVEAYRCGAEIIATVDDDNIPYPHWGENLLVGRTVELDYYKTLHPVFDPLSVTNCSHLWHRGFPIELLEKRFSQYTGKVKRRVEVQADLWDGSPDVDAVGRIAYNPEVKFDTKVPYCSNKVSPFDTQNTFFSREAIKNYYLLPHIGRMDDIWGSYILQHIMPACVAYGPASVYQKRNPHKLYKDLEDEMIGYKYSLEFATHLDTYENYLPGEAVEFIREYRRLIND